MTDNEIINALEYIRYHLTASKHKEVIDDAIDVINRLQAEIEDLRKVVIDDYATEYDNKIIAEAIKEFAEKLKEKAEILLVGQNGNYYSISDKDIDNLVKEKVGDAE